MMNLLNTNFSVCMLLKLHNELYHNRNGLCERIELRLPAGYINIHAFSIGFKAGNNILFRMFQIIHAHILHKCFICIRNGNKGVLNFKVHSKPNVKA